MRFYALLILVFAFSKVLIGQFYYNSFDEIPENLVFTNIKLASQNPDQVYHLDLSHQKIKEFPNQAYGFSNLRSLKLNGNSITKIEIKAKTLQSLEILDLSNNKISQFEIQPHSLQYLKTLNLDNNELLYFPKLGSYDFIIENLSLRYNQIAILPELNSFPYTLRVLNLANNPIKNHDVIFLTVLLLLEELDLSNTGLKSIPKNGRLDNLNRLDLSANQLVVKFFRPSNFLKLSSLNLSNTSIGMDVVIDDLVGLKQLNILNISNCSISKLPDKISLLTNLDEIVLSYNNLAKLPLTFYDLRFKKIDLKHNPLNEETKKQLSKSFKRKVIIN